MQELFLTNPTRRTSSVESKMIASYQLIQPNITNLISLNIDPAECVFGLLYVVLTQFQQATWNSFLHFNKQHSCEKALNDLAKEFHGMNQNCRKNFLNCVTELAKSDLNIDRMSSYLIRQLDNAEVVEFFIGNLDLINDSKITSQVILTFYKIIQDNLIDPKSIALIKELVLSVYKKKSSVFTCFSREIFNLPSSLVQYVVKSVNFSEYRAPLDASIYLSQLPLSIEDKLHFLLNNVPFANRSKHVQWMCDIINELPLWKLKYTIRFICCAVHPTNEALAGPIVHRWMFFLDLYNKLHTVQQKKVLTNAIVYDFYFYESGEIMNIEPAAFLLFPSDSKYVNISNALWDSFKSSLINSTFNQKQALDGAKSAFTDILKFKLISQNRLDRSLSVIMPAYKEYYNKVMNSQLVPVMYDLKDEDLYRLPSPADEKEENQTLDPMEIDLSSSAKLIINKFNKIVASDDKLGQDSKEYHLYDVIKKSLKLNEQYHSICFQEFNKSILLLPKVPLKLYDRLLLLENEYLVPLLEFAKSVISYNLYRMEQSNISEFMTTTPLVLIKTNLNFLFDSQKYHIFNDFLFKMIICASQHNWSLLSEYVNPKLSCRLKFYIYQQSQPLFLMNPNINFDFLKLDDAVTFLISDLLFFEAKVLHNYSFLVTCLEKWTTCHGITRINVDEIFESKLLECLLDIELQDYFILDILQWMNQINGKQQQQEKKMKVCHLLFTTRSNTTKTFDAKEIQAQFQK